MTNSESFALKGQPGSVSNLVLKRFHMRASAASTFWRMVLCCRFTYRWDVALPKEVDQTGSCLWVGGEDREQLQRLPYRKHLWIGSQGEITTVCDPDAEDFRRKRYVSSRGLREVWDGITQDRPGWQAAADGRFTSYLSKYLGTVRVLDWESTGLIRWILPGDQTAYRRPFGPEPEHG